MFEKVSRLKLRFETSKGLLTAEDLWDLPLTSNRNQANLDDLARSLHKKLKNGDDVSFVDTAKKSDPAIQLAFDVVKHIIEVRLAENDAAAQKRARDDRRIVLQEAIARKESEAIGSKSVDELRAELAALG